MPMIGFRAAATSSAYGWPLGELFGDELHEHVRVRVSVEVGDPPRAVADLGEKTAGLVTVAGQDDGRPFTGQPANQAGTAGHGDDRDQSGELHSSPADRVSSTSPRASTASAIASNVTAHNSVSTLSSAHDPSGDWASHSTSAMRSVVARNASSPVISYSSALPHPTRAFAGCQTPSPMAITRSWSSTAASRSPTSPLSSKHRARKATPAPTSPYACPDAWART